MGGTRFEGSVHPPHPVARTNNVGYPGGWEYVRAPLIPSFPFILFCGTGAVSVGAGQIYSFWLISTWHISLLCILLVSGDPLACRCPLNPRPMAPKRQVGNLIADLLPSVHAKGGPGSHLKARAVPWIYMTSLLYLRCSSKAHPSATPTTSVQDASLPS